MAAAADWLERRPQLGRDVFARGQPEPARVGQGRASGRAAGGVAAGNETDDQTLQDGDQLTELLRACLVALRLPANTEIYQPRQLPFWSVANATERIGRLLPTQPGGAALEVFLPDVVEQGPGRALHRRAALAATLVAGRELARGGNVTVQQAKTWGSIIATCL